MNRPAVAHWLRGNAGERTPQRIMVLDAESSQSLEGDRELHQLRCWVCRVIVRTPASAGGGTPVRVASGERGRTPNLPPSALVECAQYEGTERESLTALITRTVKLSNPWRLFSHNLSYDLGLTRLPLDLLAAGWDVGRHNLASDSPWAYFKRSGRGLWLCDSWSWLPTSVEKLGEALDLPKPKLPRESDDLEAWLRRCRADVEILSAALLELMTEWDRRRLGWWSITGPASGWNTMLHFPVRSGEPAAVARVHHSANPAAKNGSARVLIVPDPLARAFERQALYSGRRDVWKVGQLEKGPYAEVDLRQAHLSICGHWPLPYRRWAHFDHLELDDWRLEHREAGLLAECVVHTSTPRYPLRLGGIVLHPVGRFQTTLAGPEIVEARSRGDLDSIGRGYGYHLGFQMRDWAQWALAVLNTADNTVSPMLQMAVRNWGRTVPGRWGMTHAQAVKSGPSHVDGWALEPITMGSPPRRGYIFHLAGTWTQSLSDQEADDSFPAVLAYVQSYCRLALNKIIDALSPHDLVSCNTEGVWVHDAALRRVCGHGTHTCGNSCTRSDGWHYATPDLSHYVAPLEVRIKQTARTLKVLSPQHHQTDQVRLYSGVPRTADELRTDQFQFWTWPKLRGQIERGDPRGYVRERRTVNLAGVPNSRWCFEDGSTEPVEVSLGANGENLILQPSEAVLSRHGPLRASQHPALRKVLARD